MNGAGSDFDKSKLSYTSDSDILRCNKDYQALLQALAVLEAQKIQAIKDLEMLEQLRGRAIADPNSLLNELKDGTLESQVPGRQTVVQVPEINWCEYQVNVEALEEMSRGYNTRRKRSQDDRKEGEGKTKKSMKKVGSHGQPWTEEEQVRLEQLLELYPPEEVESRRWQKIANTLGNRTAKQVCCHVQKYFIKLAKAGLPVPGRMPNLANYNRKTKIKRHSSHRSLFLQSLKPRVYMTDEDGAGQPDYQSSSSSVEDDEESDESSPTSPQALSSQTSEMGVLSLYPCCSCCKKEMVGVYWACTECQDQRVMLCVGCVNSNWSSDSHSISHEMEEVEHCKMETQDNFIDIDYSKFQASTISSSPSQYNYLDPNFCPAI